MRRSACLAPAACAGREGASICAAVGEMPRRVPAAGQDADGWRAVLTSDGVAAAETMFSRSRETPILRRLRRVAETRMRPVAAVRCALETCSLGSETVSKANRISRPTNCTGNSLAFNACDTHGGEAPGTAGHPVGEIAQACARLP